MSITAPGPPTVESNADSIATKTTTKWEVHVRMPDGTEGLARFTGDPAVYDNPERAGALADHHAAVQAQRPAEDRREFFVVEAVTTRRVVRPARVPSP